MQTIMPLLSGLILIALGLLVYKYPMLISGYNTMPKKEREKIDIRPVKGIMRMCMCIMGTIIICGSLLINALGRPDWIGPFLTFVIFAGVIIMAVLVNMSPSMRNAYNTKSSKIILWISAIIIVFIFVGIIRTGQPATITVENETLNIEGTYGVKIPLKEITKAEITESIPKAIIRTNGLSFLKYHKGHFKMEQYGRSLLYLHSGKPPYLVLSTQKNGTIIINRSTREEIEALYEGINGRTIF